MMVWLICIEDIFFRHPLFHINWQILAQKEEKNSKNCTDGIPREIVNKDTVDLLFPSVSDADAFALLKCRGPKSLCEKFLEVITTELLRAIWDKGKNLHGWQFKSGKRLCGGRFDKSSCCSICVAISIFRERKNTLICMRLANGASFLLSRIMVGLLQNKNM